MRNNEILSEDQLTQILTEEQDMGGGPRHTARRILALLQEPEVEFPCWQSGNNSLIFWRNDSDGVRYFLTGGQVGVGNYRGAQGPLYVTITPTAAYHLFTNKSLFPKKELPKVVPTPEQPVWAYSDNHGCLFKWISPGDVTKYWCSGGKRDDKEPLDLFTWRVLISEPEAHAKLREFGFDPATGEKARPQRKPDARWKDEGDETWSLRIGTTEAIFVCCNTRSGIPCYRHSLSEVGYLTAESAQLAAEDALRAMLREEREFLEEAR